MTALIQLLEEGRRREREQALFYRFLTGDADAAGDAAAAERLNDLLADEQHHVSRLTARILELGGKPSGDRVVAPPVPTLEAWEAAARAREEDEVRWYEDALEHMDDPETRSILREIFVSEQHHRDELAGKWMSATATNQEEE